VRPVTGIVAGALAVLAAAACHRFVGPATEKDDRWLLDCGDGVLCDRRTEECARTTPPACRFIGRVGAAQDAGAEGGADGG
jgi:hypothetical protein